MFTEKNLQLCYKAELFFFKYGKNSTQELEYKVEEISQKREQS